MTNAKTLVDLLPADARERVTKLAEAALRLEVGEKAVRPIEAVKELLGFKKPLHARVMEYMSKGIQEAKPRAGLAALGIGGALAAAAAVKLVNKVKFQSALSELEKDPDVQVDPARAKSLAAMVARWAPSIAADPEIMKGTVKNLMKFPDSYLTYDIAKKLSEAEKEHQATHGVLALLQKRIV